MTLETVIGITSDIRQPLFLCGVFIAYTYVFLLEYFVQLLLSLLVGLKRSLKVSGFIQLLRVETLKSKCFTKCCKSFLLVVCSLQWMCDWKKR